MCPVNSQNDEKLDYAFSLANACAVARSTRRNFCLQAVDVQQFIWCQIARSTTIIQPLLFDFRKRRRAKRKASHSGSNISRSTSSFYSRNNHTRILDGSSTTTESKIETFPPGAS